MTFAERRNKIINTTLTVTFYFFYNLTCYPAYTNNYITHNAVKMTKTTYQTTSKTETLATTIFLTINVTNKRNYTYNKT